MENAENKFDVVFYGEYALFTNPFTMLTGSKYSYSVPTLSALKGMMKSIYWKPSVEWEIESVEILNKINRETKNVLLQADKYNAQQRGTNSYLKDVAYRVKAHLVPSKRTKQFSQDQEHGLAKHIKIAHSRFSRGSGYAIPVLGTSECRAFVMDAVDYQNGLKGYYSDTAEIMVDMMLLDIVYPLEPGETLYRVFWVPDVNNGVINFPDVDELIALYKANGTCNENCVIEPVSADGYNCRFPQWALADGPVIKDV